MKVLVTGGTGFVGAHAVAATLRAGHEVRLLVRRPEQVDVSLAPLGVQVRDVVVGDALDESAVSRAVDGCQAVVHAAAVFSLDPRRAEDVQRTNVRAAELVLQRAVSQGLDPVVHVSSTVALTRYGGSAADLPLGDIDRPYAQSKIDSERVARELAAAGAPVVSIYPGGTTVPTTPTAATRASGCAGSCWADSRCGQPAASTWSTCVMLRQLLPRRCSPGADRVATWYLATTWTAPCSTAPSLR